MCNIKPLLIFDYDGTIHETMALYKSAVSDTVSWLKKELEQDAPELIELPAASRLALKERFKESPGEDRLKKWIGMTPAGMWLDYAPELPEPVRNQAIRRVGMHMDRQIETASRWYPGAEEMLGRLKEQGFLMIILSNCTDYYAEAHWKHFHMERWFSAFLSSAAFGDLPKETIIRQLLTEPESALRKGVFKGGQEVTDIAGLIRKRTSEEKAAAFVIGDRASDFKGAKENGLPFFACLYGYGSRKELSGAGFFAASPKEIASLIEALEA